jgi:hypothetical protein
VAKSSCRMVGRSGTKLKLSGFALDLNVHWKRVQATVSPNLLRPKREPGPRTITPDPF